MWTGSQKHGRKAFALCILHINVVKELHIEVPTGLFLSFPLQLLVFVQSDPFFFSLLSMIHLAVSAAVVPSTSKKHRTLGPKPGLLFFLS